MIEGNFDVVVARDPDQEEWLSKRRSSGIGASESAVLLGISSSFASPLSIYTDKLGLAEETEENELAVSGRWLEKPILKMYAHRTGRIVEPDQRLLRSRDGDETGDWDFMVCTPDGFQRWPDNSIDEHLAMGPGVVEAKAVWFGDPWDEGIPARVVCQLQHQMAVTGFKWGTGVALDRGTLRWADVKRDDPFINDVLVPCCREFWARVLNQKPLPLDMIDGSKYTKAALATLFPEGDPENEPSVALGADFAELLVKREEFILVRDEYETHINEINNRFIAAIGKYTLGIMPDGSMATYRTTHKKAEKKIRGACSFRQLRFKAAPK